ncbi:MAG: methylenetetrahydrofolate--tRNA-(uracil(54)-C(5))-methyltransferase (FADH(2)-oxidizing) TrmFO [Deltaproteobacteria bacterium]|jgi:methylenetetrahydrofolate--tRNA-(uracil-5-)-methyltransferase|nr:methylenetetrahydrofolate--tRNA-(uracil(54)-C(5))-methyltransferase (FADH(2)-oxidizing) TrmFO [Deltaproteobacteria bacterium]
MDTAMLPIAVIGGGLAGCECAFALARAGLPVTIFEMKPERFSPAHKNACLAELVCSNSFRSDAPDTAVGLLKEEMRLLGSLTMRAAENTRVPAGGALAVDRDLFAASVSASIGQQPGITLVRREIGQLDDPLLAPFGTVVIAAGPLAGEGLAASLAGRIGREHLYFYDAIAPIVDAATINMAVAFPGARKAEDPPDYLNCPLSREEYHVFREALCGGQKTAPRPFEAETHFEGCLPVETLAGRGELALAFGPLKPVGFSDPRTGKRPFALLQLRAENANKSMFNLVGCQTKLTQPEQLRVFRLIPGLEQAEFVRFGSMHRNTFIQAPVALRADLALLADPRFFLAGQITGVEGYAESAASGLWLGLYLARRAWGKSLAPPPLQSALGALLGHLRTPARNFQPSNVQYGLMPDLEQKARRADRRAAYAKRARAAFLAWMQAGAVF